MLGKRRVFEERKEERRLSVVFDGWAGADEVAIAESVVDTGDRGPELVGASPRGGVGGLFARIGPIPFGGHDDLSGVRGVFEGVVVFGEFALFDGADLFADGDHGVTKAIEFGFGFAFGGFDHQRSGDRPRHGGCVETVVHEAFCDIDGFDIGADLEGAQIDDKLVSHEILVATEEDVVVLFEAFGHVVGVEDRHLRGLFEAVAAHHGDVHPRDGEDACAAERGCCDRADGLGGCVGLVWMPGKEGDKVRSDADRSHARTTAAVRDAIVDNNAVGEERMQSTHR